MFLIWFSREQAAERRPRPSARVGRFCQPGAIRLVPNRSLTLGTTRAPSFNTGGPAGFANLKNRQPRGAQQQKRSRGQARKVTPARQGERRVADAVAEFEKDPEQGEPTSCAPA